MCQFFAAQKVGGKDQRTENNLGRIAAQFFDNLILSGSAYLRGKSNTRRIVSSNGRFLFNLEPRQGVHFLDLRVRCRACRLFRLIHRRHCQHCARSSAKC